MRGRIETGVYSSGFRSSPERNPLAHRKICSWRPRMLDGDFNALFSVAADLTA
jgi:hypothetical protein